MQKSFKVRQREEERQREEDVSSWTGGFGANDVPLVFTRLLYNS